MDKILTKIGYDKFGTEVAWEYRCNKPGCNCVGKWTNGDELNAVRWEPVDIDQYYYD